MANKTKELKLEDVPEPVRRQVDAFIEACNDPTFIMLMKQFEATEKEKAFEQQAAARRIEELKREEQHIAERLKEIRTQIDAASETA